MSDLQSNLVKQIDLSKLAIWKLEVFREIYLLHLELWKGLNNLDNIVSSDQVEHSSNIFQDLVIELWVLDVEIGIGLQSSTNFIEFHSIAELRIVDTEFSQEWIVEVEIVSNFLLVEGTKDLEVVPGESEAQMVLQ